MATISVVRPMVLGVNLELEEMVGGVGSAFDALAVFQSARPFSDGKSRVILVWHVVGPEVPSTEYHVALLDPANAKKQFAAWADKIEV